MPAVTEARLRRVAIAWIVILSVVGLMLAGAVQAGSLHFSDWLLLTTAQAPHSRGLDLAMTVVSAAGTIEVTGVLIIVLCLRGGSKTPSDLGRWIPLAVFIGVTGVELLGKTLIHQAAPPDYLLRGFRLPGLGAAATTAYSFPSGHMVRGTLVLGIAALRLARRTRRIVWLWLCVAAVWILGFSRVYLGEHWPADVAGGILVGGIAIAACLALSPRVTIGDLTPEPANPVADARAGE